MSLLRELVSRYPDGLEATIRYGLHVALQVDPYAVELKDYMPRLSVLKHRNGFGEVRLDCETDRRTGQIVFALGVEQPGDWRSMGGEVRVTYFGAEAETQAAVNLILCRASTVPSYPAGGLVDGKVPYFFG